MVHGAVDYILSWVEGGIDGEVVVFSEVTSNKLIAIKYFLKNDYSFEGMGELAMVINDQLLLFTDLERVERQIGVVLVGE